MGKRERDIERDRDRERGRDGVTKIFVRGGGGRKGDIKGRTGADVQ